MNASNKGGTSAMSPKPISDDENKERKQAKQERQERLEQQRMDNESPAAKDAPLPGEHVPASWAPRCGAIPRLIQICRAIAGAYPHIPHGAGLA
jgi:hypothetical protein